MVQSVWKRNQTTLLIAAVLAAALLLVYFAANQDDYYRASILPDEFETAGDGTLVSERLMLEAGAYTFTVGYAAEGGAQAQIVNDLAADEQGEPSPVAGVRFAQSGTNGSNARPDA